MVNISAERINATSPYKVKASGTGCYVDFTTDYGVKYSVGYEPSDLLSCTDAYDFIIINANNKKSPLDHKLRDTIIAIVADFFRHNETAMLYICETSDNKQSMRSRLFAFWASKFPDHDQYATASGSVTDEEGNENFATLIIPHGHPKADEAIKEFYDAINALKSKPTH